MPCIAVVPRVRSHSAKLALFGNGAHRHEPVLASDRGPRSIARTDSPIWTVTDAIQSRFTEAFLEIKLTLNSMSRNGKRSQVIGITSTYPDEGKSSLQRPWRY